MSFKNSLRRLLCLAFCLGLFFLALAPSQAKGGLGGDPGCPTPGDGTIYYSDASHTEEVGSCWSDCCNCSSCTCSGEITPYAVHVPVNWLWCPPSSSL
jgi:hypothetical protein